jgi:hypothetical protein
VSDKVSDKMKEASERAKGALDKKDKELEKAAETVEPYLHEGREQAAEAEKERKEKIRRGEW